MEVRIRGKIIKVNSFGISPLASHLSLLNSQVESSEFLGIKEGRNFSLSNKFNILSLSNLPLTKLDEKRRIIRCC